MFPPKLTASKTLMHSSDHIKGYYYWGKQVITLTMTATHEL